MVVTGKVTAAKILLVDDEDKFRDSLKQRLELRGYPTIALNSGQEAVKTVKRDPDIDVVILDRKMPGVDGEQVLKEIKEFRPELQVIFLTGFGSVDSAMEVGRLDAYAYLEKPCDLENLIQVVTAARADKVHAMARHEVPAAQKGSVREWLIGTHNSRPGVILLGLLVFLGIIFAPTPGRMASLLSAEKTGELTDAHMGYAYYRSLRPGETIPEYYARSYQIGDRGTDPATNRATYTMSLDQAAFRAKVMLGSLVVAALFWATGAVPIGITALLIGVLMYLMGVFRPDDVAAAYAKDAVVFIFGVLAMAKVISKTGLDRRIGLLLLSPVKSLSGFLFIFLPIMGVACSFLSEHALVAFLMPMFMLVYSGSTQREGIKADPALATVFVLGLCYAANCGGPGSPAAGGRNAIMIGILGEYGAAPTFAQWVVYGLPYVPVMGIVIGAYFYVVMRRRVKVKELNASRIVRQACEKIGPMDTTEYVTAFILAGLIFLWVAYSDVLGMGGPVILALVLLNFFRILRWKDVAGIHWEVVALYASASAVGKGLAVTGAALYLADGFVMLLPEIFSSGTGLAISASLFTGITTNFMSDGATVSALGPITVPMAIISNTHPWMVGLATAFASSFAHMLIIGTPNNAIAYAMAKDPVTGEQLVTLTDFLKHGTVVLVLSLLVLWFWAFLGYWQIIGF
jgi:solute carrier family 13 (sodium-dependent dicarboxylate transporter), member 2/3/5